MAIKDKKQLGEQIVFALDLLLKKIIKLETSVNQLQESLDGESESGDEFLLEPINSSDEVKKTRASHEKSFRFVSDESELSESSIHIYNGAEDKIIENPSRYLKMIDLYNKGVKKKDINKFMDGRPYHSYGSVCKMLRVGIRRGYIVSDGIKLTSTDKLLNL